MSRIRRHVRGWTFAWLVIQAASLAAFVPRDCCASHRPHHSEPAAAAGEADCPLHRAASSEPDCYLRAVCGGPMAALPMVWSHPGLPPASVASLSDLHESAALEPLRQRALTTDVFLDTPPPRI